MTTETRFECVACDGRGETDSGSRELATGAIIGTRCGHCNGSGVVATEQTICDGCEQTVFTDALCPHRSADLCPACASDCCVECRSLAAWDDHADDDAWWEDAS